MNGCSAAGLADPAAVADLSPGQLTELIATSQQVESVLVARRLGAIAELLHRHSTIDAIDPTAEELEHAMITGYERTYAEVSALLNLSPSAAGYQVYYAEALDTRLPRVGELLARGRLDWRTVQLIISRTDLVDGEFIDSLDEQLAARAGAWRSWSRQRIINTIDAAVLAADPDAARQRRKDADRGRFIGISPDTNGMAEVHGKVAAGHAAAFDRRLSQLARQVCNDDPRSIDQRRVDALSALTEGRALACACARRDCPTRHADAPAGAAQTRVIINVIATAETVTGDSQRPGYLDGYGVIDADQVRELAEAAAHRILDTPIDPAAALRYQPSASLARMVRCRDLTCRFPGCSRPAMRCDLDHTIAFNHANPVAGRQTVLGNTKCLCRFHHRLKTFGGWRDRQLPDGTVEWTSPTGRVFQTTPGSADVIPELADALSATAHSPRPGRARVRARQRAAQIARSRHRNRVTRKANEVYALRKAEIQARRFRNRMRDMLLLFKGTPSTSSLCTWVNEPREPEELPADWVPPPVPQLPDEPPF